MFELDRTDAATASVTINDPDGLLDPTNTTGPHYGLIEAGLQARIRCWNPVLSEWQTRYRGWVADWDYDVDPSQRVTRLTLQLTDIMDRLGAIEMLPGYFGHDATGKQVKFNNATMQDRITAVLGDAHIPPDWYVAFSGNVWLMPTVYSDGESPLTVVHDAADAEFPAVSNVYTDSIGRLAAHGRFAKFDPAGVASGATPGAWNWHHWKAGDSVAVAADLGQVAQIREESFNRGTSKIINSALASPQWVADPADPTKYLTYDDALLLLPPASRDRAVIDDTSIETYGLHSWSSENLQTDSDLVDGADGLTATQRMAEYFVSNYAEPRNRITNLAFRTIRPGAPGAAVTWLLLTRIDISDRLDLTVGHPGGGGFNLEPFYVEGVHETVRPLGPDYDYISLTVDLSPQAYFTVNPFPEPTA